MSKIQENGWYKDEGYENFQDFILAEMGMKYRKAMYFIEIYNYLTVAQIPYAKVKNVGWTKLKEIACLLTDDNVDELVKKAEGMNTLQLIDEVKLLKSGSVEKVDNSSNVNPLFNKTFSLYADQKATVIEALDQAKNICGTEHDSVALENICLDFLGKPFPYVGEKTPKTALPEISLVSMLKEKGTQEAIILMQEAFPDTSIKVEKN